MKIREKLRKIRFLNALASLKITVTGLVLLFILTLWGTIAQVQSGLYLAQERFFHSFFFTFLGFIPFPGGQLVMWVLFFNLIAVMLVRFVYSWRNIGILVIHFGLLLFLVSGYVTLHGAKESHLTLREGEASNVSSAFHTWELAIWEGTESSEGDRRVRNITAVDVARVSPDQDIVLEKWDVRLSLVQYHRNAHAYLSNDGSQKYINVSGIQKLVPVKLEKEPEKNTPGVIARISAGDQEFTVLLYGAENKSTALAIDGSKINFMLRLKRYPLPFMLKLIDFIKEEHPGTDTARSYKSRVAIEVNGAWREKLISMNNPLRYKDYTFYQSSFSIDKFQQERSTLAVVKNSGRILPYIATFVTVAGLIIHFMAMAFRSRPKAGNKKKAL